jgi:hypothetical protein
MLFIFIFDFERKSLERHQANFYEWISGILGQILNGY